MRLFLDVNMLLYVVFNSYTEHEICRDWFEDAMDDTANRIGFPIAALLGFVRLSTQSKSSFLPITMVQALELVEDWVKQPNAYVPQPGDGHIEQVVSLLRSVNGNPCGWVASDVTMLNRAFS